jgi:DNA mismatch endonuclease (patch repair protein)
MALQRAGSFVAEKFSFSSPGALVYRGAVADHLSRRERSANMAAIRSKNTSPELAVRKVVHALGYRYRLHDPKLPGRPDLVFPSRHKALFVHGCFWHRHNGCKRATVPQTRRAFWEAKLSNNVRRDRRDRRTLRELGWKVLTAWQCELRNPAKLRERLDEFLSS